VADEMLAALRVPFFVRGREVFLTASVGLLIAEQTGHHVGAAEGLRDVDQAMYAAKAAGRNRVAEFRPELLDERLRKARMTAELRHAMSRGELTLHYQPIVGLTDGDVAGVEALARWPRPDRTMVPPAEFIPLAEEAGLIVDLGRWVLGQACHDASRWYPVHRTSVGVNVSGRQLDEPTFVDMVTQTLDDTGLPGRALILELTESSLIEADEAVIERLDRLRANGVRIVIDDFGTGYSSLSYITRLPVDAVKIDSSFTPNPVDAALPAKPWMVVSAILRLVSSLGLPTVAEGIETEEQAETLKNLNCRFGQGYYFSPPVPADRLEEFLRRQPRRVDSAGAPR
jgi:EAL domain-containing protein (putative c-di-GMP-specific phosphodiesterase class I)